MKAEILVSQIFVTIFDVFIYFVVLHTQQKTQNIHPQNLAQMASTG